MEQTLALSLQKQFLFSMEATVINHILVPLDGSTLAECVLPHVIAIAPVTNARVTLVHVMQHAQMEAAVRRLTLSNGICRNKNRKNISSRLSAG